MYYRKTGKNNEYRTKHLIIPIKSNIECTTDWADVSKCRHQNFLLLILYSINMRAQKWNKNSGQEQLRNNKNKYKRKIIIKKHRAWI